MVNLGIIAGIISDNKAIKLDEDSVGTDAPYLFGSIYNNNTTSVTVNIQINTKDGLKNSDVPLNGSQKIVIKGLQLHSIQCLNTSPSLNYAFSVVELQDGSLIGEIRY